MIASSWNTEAIILYNYKVLPWDGYNSSDTSILSLQNRVPARLEIVNRFARFSGHV